MLDYLKTGNKILLAIMLIFSSTFLSCCTVNSTQLKKEEIQEENSIYIKAKEEEQDVLSIKEEITEYANNNLFCLYPNNCNEMNIKNIKNIKKIIDNHGWREEEYFISMDLFKDKNIRYLTIIVIIKSKVLNYNYVIEGILKAKKEVIKI